MFFRYFKLYFYIKIFFGLDCYGDDLFMIDVEMNEI